MRICVRAVIGACLLFVPFTFAVEPRTQPAMDAKRAQLIGKLLLDGYAQSQHDPKWDAEAQQLIRDVAWHMQPGHLSEWSGTPELHDRAALRKRATQLYRKNCREPHALMVAAWVLIEHRFGFDPDNRPDPDGVMSSSLAYESLKKAKSHPLLRLMFVQHLRDVRANDGAETIGAANRGALEKDWPALAVETLKSGVFKEAGHDFAALMLRDWIDAGGQRPVALEYRDAILTSPAADEWIKLVIDGSTEIEQAWEARGGGFIDTVSPQARKQFARHLAAARQKLNKAAGLDLAANLPAKLMITVAMGTGRNKEAREWFDLATTLQPDDTDAWGRMFNAASPRWGGTLSDVKSLAVKAASSKAFDTQQPWLAINALRQIANDTTIDNLRDPELFKLVQGVCDGYRKRLPPGMSIDAIDSQEAVFAYAANDYVAANAVLQRLGERLYPSAVSWLGTDKDFFRMKTAALASDVAAELSEIIRTVGENARAELSRLTVLQSKIAPGHPAWPYVAFRKHRANYLNRFLGSEITPILGEPDDIHSWHFAEGGVKVDAAGVATVDPKRMGKQGMVRISYRPPVPGNYVLRGTIDLGPPQEKRGRSVSVLASCNWFNSMANQSFVFSERPEKRIEASWMRPNHVNFDFGNQAKFEAYVYQNELTLYVDNKPVVLRRQMERRGHNSVGFEFNAETNPGVRLTDVTLQRIGPGAAQLPE